MHPQVTTLPTTGQADRDFFPTVPFMHVARKLRGCFKLLQGYSVDSARLAFLMETKGGSSSEYRPAALAFGFLQYDPEPKTFTLTPDGRALCMAPPDSPEWKRIAAQMIHSTPVMATIFQRLGLEADDAELDKLLASEGMKLSKIVRFRPIYRQAASLAAGAPLAEQTPLLDAAGVPVPEAAPDSFIGLLERVRRIETALQLAELM